MVWFSAVCVRLKLVGNEVAEIASTVIVGEIKPGVAVRSNDRVGAGIPPGSVI